MFGLALLTTVGITLITTAVLSVVATRDSALMPATVNPFSTADHCPSSADTLPNATYATATLTGDWKTTEVQSLHQVEDVLDWLENHNVRQTELQRDDGKFVVRWR